MKRNIFLITALALIAFGFVAQDAYADGAVAGVVIDAEGEPVAGAMVTIMAAERVRGERPFRARFETGDNGTFGWREVPAGRYYIHAGAREVGVAREIIGVRDRRVTRLELQLADPREGREGRGENGEIEFGSVVGQVVNADGEPIADAVVTISMRIGRRMRPLRMITNERGIFEFERVPAGNGAIMAGVRRVGRVVERIEVVAGEETRLRLVIEGGRGGGH